MNKSVASQIFWLSYFKPQLSCPGDEFVEAMRQVAEISGVSPYFYSKIRELEMFIASDVNNYIVNLEENSDWVITQIEGLMAECQKVNGMKTLFHQLKFNEDTKFGDNLMSDLQKSGYNVSDSDKFEFFKDETSDIGKARLATVTGYEDCDLVRRIQHAKSLDIPKKRLVLRFE